MSFDPETLALAERVLNANRSIGRTVATAESCTGGLVSGALTEIAGSSDVVERGFVTYSNEAKTQMLGVAVELIETFGAVILWLTITDAETVHLFPVKSVTVTT